MRHTFSVRKSESITFLKLVLNTENSYSLGFDKWSNFEETSYVTVTIFYINHLQTIQSRILFTVEANNTDHRDWTHHFDWLRPAACSAAILNFDPIDVEPLAAFFQEHDIPTMPCFVWVIDCTARRCMDAPVIVQLMEAAQQCLSTDAARECLSMEGDVVQPPRLHSQFWLSKYKYLEFVCNFCARSFDDDNEPLNELLSRIKVVLEAVGPLVVSYEQH